MSLSNGCPLVLPQVRSDFQELNTRGRCSNKHGLCSDRFKDYLITTDIVADGLSADVELPNESVTPGFAS